MQATPFNELFTAEGGVPAIPAGTYLIAKTDASGYHGIGRGDKVYQVIQRGDRKLVVPTFNDPDTREVQPLMDSPVIIVDGDKMYYERNTLIFPYTTPETHVEELTEGVNVDEKVLLAFRLYAKEAYQFAFLDFVIADYEFVTIDSDDNEPDPGGEDTPPEDEPTE